MKPFTVLFGFALFLQGCTYAISPPLAHQADKTISFKKLQDDPESAKGRLLILGGTIAQTTTLKEGTLLEIAQKNLDYWGKPVRTKRTGGTFFILYPGYLNTMVYVPGVDVTVAGEVLGHDSTVLGDKQYGYPVLLSKELKVWERERPSWDKPGWMDPLSNPNAPASRE